jgi:hypothetical protein
MGNIECADGVLTGQRIFVDFAIPQQFRFAHAAGTLRHLDAGLELESLFF